MELRVLGPLEVVDDADVPVEVAGTKLKALLVVLGLRAGEVVQTRRIIESVWGEREIRDPVNAVQVLVSKLRRSLHAGREAGDRDLVVTAASGYSLNLAPDAVDAVRFERLVTKGRELLASGEIVTAAGLLREALALWRGEALADFVEEDFARGERARLEELKASAIEQCLQADLALGRNEEVLVELERLVVEYPFREALRGLQMLALYRAGRQADALRAFQIARSVLGDEVGLEPGPELQRLEAAILTQDPALDLAPRRGGNATPGNLRRPNSSFIGRVTELRELGELVGNHRLVTVVGPGGAGKTRLALEAAERARPDHPDGCWLVELAPLSDPTHVEAAVAAELGIDDTHRLDDYLKDRQLLIVLDNCEHLVDAAAALAVRLVDAGSGVRVLATSREALGVAGERRWVLPPLAASDAGILFVDRALVGGMSQTGLQPTLVDEICAQLDGLPLAIELAAARTRTLSLSDIAMRIGDRFRLLTTGERTAQPRQQTLRSLVDWSYDLLFSEEQRAFRRLSVFAGQFGLPAAEFVCAIDDIPSADVLDILGHLVDKSLVSVVSDVGATRYQLLQTLAEYGRQRLLDAGEHDAACDRHLQWIRKFAADADVGLHGPEQLSWAAAVSAERGNIRVAVEWALRQGRFDDAIATVADVAYGWHITGAVNEGRALLESVLAHTSEGSSARLAVAHAWAAWLTQFGSGITQAVSDHAETAIELARQADSRTFSHAAVIGSMIRERRGLTDEAFAVIEEAVSRLEAEPDWWGQARVDWAQAGLALRAGDIECAALMCRRSVAGFESGGDRCGVAVAAFRLSDIAERQGDYDQAIETATTAYEAVVSLGVQAVNASTLATRLGDLAVAQGRFDDAAEWHAKGLARAREGGYVGATAQALTGIAHAALVRGLIDEAEHHYREALAVYESIASAEGTATSLAALGSIAGERGEYSTASELYWQSLRAAVTGNDRRAVALAVEGLASVSATDGDGVKAARLVGAAEALRRTSGHAIATLNVCDTERTLAAIRALIAEEVFAAERSIGRLQVDELVAELVRTDPAGLQAASAER